MGQRNTDAEKAEERGRRIPVTSEHLQNSFFLLTACKYLQMLGIGHTVRKADLGYPEPPLDPSRGLSGRGVVGEGTQPAPAVLAGPRCEEGGNSSALPSRFQSSEARHDSRRYRLSPTHEASLRGPLLWALSLPGTLLLGRGKRLLCEAVSSTALLRGGRQRLRLQCVGGRVPAEPRESSPSLRVSPKARHALAEGWQNVTNAQAPQVMVVKFKYSK